MTMLPKEVCTRCGGEMQSLGFQRLQRGRYGLVLKNLSNLFSGSLDVEMMVCTTCGKMELYSYQFGRGDGSQKEDTGPKVSCDKCGTDYDPGLAECPRCGAINIQRLSK